MIGPRLPNLRPSDQQIGVVAGAVSPLEEIDLARVGGGECGLGDAIQFVAFRVRQSASEARPVRNQRPTMVFKDLAALGGGEPRPELSLRQAGGGPAAAS